MTHLQPLPDRPLLTTNEVAAALGVTASAVGKYAKRGWIPGAFHTLGEGRGPGRWRIPRASAETVLRELGVAP